MKYLSDNTFLWKGRQIIILTLLTCSFLQAKTQFIFDIPGATGTYITGINDSMEFCGYASFPGGLTRAFVKTENDTIMLDYISQFSPTWAGGINNLGQVVCRYNNAGGSFDYHAYIYDINDGGYTLLSQLDGYELLSPNDISDTGWISGDLKSGSQRRIFTYHPDYGLATNFVLLNSEVKPTFGGHYISNEGRCSAFWIDGNQHRSTFYDAPTSSFPGPIISIPDPNTSAVIKTQLMGGNGETILVSQFQSKTAYTYDLSTLTIGERFYMPYATQVFAMDINTEGYIVGHFIDSAGVAHGFFQTDVSRAFSPDQDGWSFFNSSEDCWSEEMYDGFFDYSYDDYWNVEHDETIDFPLAPNNAPYPSSQFIPWRTYVSIFGEEACYDFDPNVNYVEQNPNAFAGWKYSSKADFEGICLGMSTTAILNKQDPQLLFNRFPVMEEVLAESLPASLSYEDNMGHTIGYCARSQWYFFSNQFQTDNQGQEFMEPIDYLYQLYPEFSPSFNLHYRVTHIMLKDQELHAHHALVPYRISRDTSSINKYRVWVYDPNEPLSLDKYILINYADTGSSYAYIFDGVELPYNQFGLKHLIIRRPFLEEPTLLSYVSGYENRDSYVAISLGYSPETTITSDNGESIVVNGLNYQNTIEGSQSIDAITGHYTKPNKFELPVGNYDIETVSQDFKPISVFLNSNSGIISMSRSAEEIIETNHFTLEQEKLYYNNTTSEIRHINIHIVTKEDDTSLQYFVDDISVNPGQSLGLQIINPTQVVITSNGAATNYNVRIRIFNPETGFWEAVASNVPIGTNVTQLIIPSLTDDTMDGIIIETDANQDGTYEGSEGFDNEGVPNMMLSIAEVEISNTGGSESFHVSNVGAGNLNWNVVYAPSWITVNTGATGVNHGAIEFTVAENTTSAGRQDYLIVEASAPANDQDTVLVIQGEGGIIGIDNLKLNGSAVSMMPNPANDRVQFAVEHNFVGNASYTIYSSTGQMVREGQMRGQKEIINTSQMERGVYQVKFNLNGKIIIKKLALS